MAYREILCNDADDFWEHLDPRNPLKGKISNKDTEELIYRGQADSNWLLVPSSLRQFNFDKQIRNSLYTSEKQVENEFLAINDFINHRGFRTQINQKLVGIDTERLFDRSYFNQRFSTKLSEWPSKEYYPIVAIAQHHGVKTQLLDWTNYSYIAAYFAAESHLWNDYSDTEFIAIWVYKPNDNRRVKTKMLPLSSDKNMFYQNGCFTVVDQLMMYGKKFEISTIDDLSTEDNLCKLMLHKNYVPDIMRYCYLHKIDVSSIYDYGCDGIAKSIEEKKRWQKMLGKVICNPIFTDPSLDIGGLM